MRAGAQRGVTREQIRLGGQRARVDPRAHGGEQHGRRASRGVRLPHAARRVPHFDLASVYNAAALTPAPETQPPEMRPPAAGKLAAPAEGVGGAYANYVLGVLVLVYVFNFLDRQILSILAEDIKADLGVTDAQIGFLYGTAFAVFYAIFGIPLGRLADVWNRRTLIALGLGVLER